MSRLQSTLTTQQTEFEKFTSSSQAKQTVSNASTVTSNQERLQSTNTSLTTGNIVSIKQENSMNSVDSLVASYVDSTTFLNSPTGSGNGSVNQTETQSPSVGMLTNQSAIHLQQGTVLVSGQTTTVPLGSLSPDDLTGSSHHHHNINPLSINVNLAAMGMVNPTIVTTNRRINLAGHNVTLVSGDELTSEFVNTFWSL